MQPISSITVGSVMVLTACNIPTPPLFSLLLPSLLTLIQGVWWVLVGPSTISMLFLQYDLPFVTFFIVRYMTFNTINACDMFAILAYAAYVTLILNG
jgi:hypothetical protein